MRTEEEELRDDARARRLLAGLPSGAPGATARVRARVVAGARTPIPSVRWGRVAGVGVVAALAAAALLTVAQRRFDAVPAPVPVPTAALSAEDGWRIDNSVANVSLSFQGSGELSGTSDAPHIAWEAGTLNVEVNPDHGVKLAVETREAEVRVVGTGFTVNRDARGTHVEVRHGRVEVDCGAELTRVLTAGDDVSCLPTSAAGLLLRARTLQGEGAAPALVLESVERGLAVSDKSAAVADELAATRVRALVDLGRPAEALAAARDYLAGPAGARRHDVELLAATAAVSLGGCATAAPWLVGTAPGAQAICAP